VAGCWGTRRGSAPCFGIALLIGAGGDWGAWPLALTGLSLVVILAKWLEVMGSLYQVTPERLIVRKGEASRRELAASAERARMVPLELGQRR
jgi:hypothetical protein